jgi:hypothetical protein
MIALEQSPLGVLEMEAVREILDSSMLEPIIPLPASFKNRKVEVFVFPHVERRVRPGKRHSAFGSLHSYVRPGLIDLEEGAFAQALAEKHADS